MSDKEPQNDMTTPNVLVERLQVLEENFLYQEKMIDALNEVIIEQQTQLNSLHDDISRLQAILSTMQDHPDNAEDPPPPHY
jgi:uncharacterized coiled-coil protein SlyX